MRFDSNNIIHYLDEFPHLVFTSKINGQIVAANQKCLEYFGKELTGFIWLDQLEPLVASEIREWLGKPKKASLSFTKNSRIHHQESGEKEAVKITLVDSVIRDEVLVFVVQKEKSDTRYFYDHSYFEEALQQAKANQEDEEPTYDLFKLIADNCADIIVLRNLQGKIIYLSPSISLLGYTSEEASRFTYNQLLPPEDRAKLDQAIQKSLITQQDFSLTLRTRHKEGHFLWFENRFKMLTYGKEHLILTISTDVTNQVETDRKLEAMFANTRQSVILVDRNFKLAFFNKTAQEGSKLAFGRELNLGDDYTRFVTEANQEEFTNNLQKCFNGESFDLTNHFKMGDYDVQLRAVLEPIKASRGDKITHVMITSEDISERVSLQQKKDGYFRIIQATQQLSAISLEDDIESFPKEVSETYLQFIKGITLARFYSVSADRKLELEYDFIDDEGQAVFENAADFPVDQVIPVLEAGSPFNKAILQKKPLISSDPQEIEQILKAHVSQGRLKEFAAMIQQLFSIQSFGIIPFCNQKAVLGIFAFASSEIIPSGEIENISQLTNQVTSILDKFRMKEELKANEKRLKRASEFASLGSWEWDPKTGENWWSPEVYRIFTISSETTPRGLEHQAELLTDESFRLLSGAVDEALKRQKPYDLILQTHPDFGNKFVRARGACDTNEKGEVVKLWGTIQDITKLKKTENRLLEKNKKLLRLNQQMDLILKSLSHDLKSPINRSLGLLELHATSEDLAEKEMFIKLVKENVQRVDVITNELIELFHVSKFEKAALDKVDWHLLLDACKTELEALENFSKVNIRHSVVESAPTFLEATSLKIILESAGFILNQLKINR